MTRTKAIALTASAAILAGCAVTTPGAAPPPAKIQVTAELGDGGATPSQFRAAFRSLRVGMSKQEVSATLGFPPASRADQRWLWSFWNARTARSDIYWVRFSRGELVEVAGAGTD